MAGLAERFAQWAADEFGDAVHDVIQLEAEVEFVGAGDYDYDLNEYEWTSGPEVEAERARLLDQIDALNRRIEWLLGVGA